MPRGIIVVGMPKKYVSIIYSVTDLILVVAALLKRDINRLVLKAWEVLKLVKLWDKR